VNLATIDRIFAAALLGLGVMVVLLGLDFGYTRRGVPGPGFFPFWTGLALCVLSSVNLLRSVAGKEAYAERMALHQVIAILGVAASLGVYLVIARYLGMLLALPLLVLGIAYSIDRSWNRRLATRIFVIALALPVACYLVFAWFLNVRLVEGPLGF